MDTSAANTEMTEPENDSAAEAPKKKSKISHLKEKKKLIIIITITAAITAGISGFFITKHSQKGHNNQITMVKAEKRSIQNTVTGSSSVEANDSYDISAMVTGEVLTDNFNEGDKVTKEQVLYTIKADDAQNSVESADDVVAVPVSAVNRGNIVYVKGDKTEENDKAPDGYRSVKIETGINDTSYIEVKSGLNEGDEIKGANSASGNETSGTADAQTQTGGMPGMGGGMPGGGMPGGGMPGGGMPGGGMPGGGASRGGGGMPGGGR